MIDNVIIYLEKCVKDTHDEINKMKERIKNTDDHNIVMSYVNAINRNITIIGKCNETLEYIQRLKSSVKYANVEETKKTNINDIVKNFM